MDLSFPLPDPAAASAASAADLASLTALLEQSPITATAAVRVAGDLLAPAHGAFNAAMAARLTRWQRP